MSSILHNKKMGAETLLQSFGYIVIFVCVFIECGLLLGLILPLPGFSLLFAAGVFAAAGRMDLLAIMIIGSLGAICGYLGGYFTGSRYGRKLFYEKNTGPYFTKKQGLATERFMKKYGYSALFLGRFLPIAHNVVPLLSGVAKTPFKPFMIINIVGGIAWVVSTTLLGFYAGKTIPNAQYIMLPFIVALVIFANTPFGKKFMANLLKRFENTQ